MLTSNGHGHIQLYGRWQGQVKKTMLLLWRRLIFFHGNMCMENLDPGKADHEKITAFKSNCHKQMPGVVLVTSLSIRR